VAVVLVDGVDGLSAGFTGDHLETFGPSLNRLRKVVSAKVAP
jgi:hypothetical protein